MLLSNILWRYSPLILESDVSEAKVTAAGNAAGKESRKRDREAMVTEQTKSVVEEEIEAVPEVVDEGGAFRGGGGPDVAIASRRVGNTLTIFKKN